MDVDKEVIEYVEDKGYGGVMFWAINETGFITSDKTGLNVN
jgi:GH18 family chitinase